MPWTFFKVLKNLISKAGLYRRPYEERIPMIKASALGLLLLLPVQDTPKYEGKYRAHPNIAQLLASVNSSKDEARMQIPKRLGVPVPDFTLDLVDLDNLSREEPQWPPRGGIRKFDEERREQEKWTVYLQMDYFVGDPTLARPSLLKEIAKISLYSANKRENIGRRMFRPSGTWLLDAFAANFAGVADNEIAFTLAYAVDHSEKLDSLVVGMTEAPPPKNMREGFLREVTYEGRLTPHYSAKLIAKSGGGEKQYFELMEAVYRGQAFESVLKKATGKNIEQFNAAIQAEFKTHLGKLLPKADIDSYKKIADLVERKDFDIVLKTADELLKKTPNSPLAGNLHYWKGRALYELKKPEAAESFKTVLSKYRSLTPLAKDAQYYLALLIFESGNPALAKSEFERLRDDFGWDARSVQKATEYLDKLRG